MSFIPYLPMRRFIRPLAIAALALPLAFQAAAETVNQSLPRSVAKALQAYKIDSDALSVVLLPLNASAAPTFINAEISINPASTIKLVTTYASLELLGPNHRWKTEFYV